MKLAEQALAVTNPICEQIYANDDKTNIKDKNKALKLYNSMVPKIKGHNFRFAKCSDSIKKKDILKNIQFEKLVNFDLSSDEKH